MVTNEISANDTEVVVLCAFGVWLKCLGHILLDRIVAGPSPKSPRQLESDAGEEASAAFSMTMAAKLEAKTRARCEAASAC